MMNYGKVSTVKDYIALLESVSMITNCVYFERE